MQKPKVAFICVHNSCRSQMAEAISKILAPDAYKAHSAGTHIRDRINPDAVDIIRELYGVDMEATQKPKLIEDIPPVDVVITMGCNVECPYLPSRFREDWGLEDPSGKGREAFIAIVGEIEKRVLELKEKIQDVTKRG